MLTLFKKVSYTLFCTTLFVLSSGANALLLTTSDPHYVGMINPDIPASEAQEETYVNFLIGLGLNTTATFSNQSITRSGFSFPSLPTVDFPQGGNIDTGGTGNDVTFNLLANSAYILGKYDAGNAGAWVWYVGDLAAGTSITLPGTFTGGQYALSHYVVGVGTSSGGGGGSGNVPEPTSSALILIGIVTLGMAFGVRRRTLRS